MQQWFKVLLMMFGFSQLFSCGQSNRLSDWIGHDKKLSEQDAQVISQWLLDNDLKAEDFQVIKSPKGHSGEFSVIVVDRQIESIRAKGVKSLQVLSELPALNALELNHFKQSDLSDCPKQIKSLRLSGHQLTALDGVNSCQQLEQITAVHSAVASLGPLLNLPKLTSVKINHSQLSSVEISHSVPELKLLNLKNNQINAFVIKAELPKLETLSLSNNQLSTIAHNNLMPLINVLSIAQNKIQNLETVTPINSLKHINLKGNPLQDLASLENWPNLKVIDFDDELSDPSAPISNKIRQHNGPFELHLAEAEYLKESYLNNTEFVETLPQSVTGKALGVNKKISSYFDLHSDPKVSGHINIASLNGLMRLPVTKTKDLLQYDRKIVMRGQVTVKQGQLILYSPIEQDFWSMAKLFVDTPIKQRPKDRDDLILKGFTVNRIAPNEPQEFDVNLVAMAGNYFLLLGSDQGKVTDVHLEFE